MFGHQISLGPQNCTRLGSPCLSDLGSLAGLSPGLSPVLVEVGQLFFNCVFSVAKSPGQEPLGFLEGQ